MDCSPPGSSVHGILQARILEWKNKWKKKKKNTGVDSHSLLQGIFLTQLLSPGLNSLQMNSLLSEPPGKPSTSECAVISFIRLIFFKRKILIGYKMNSDGRWQKGIILSSLIHHFSIRCRQPQSPSKHSYSMQTSVDNQSLQRCLNLSDIPETLLLRSQI